MPLLEPVVLEGRGYTLRHIGPKADIWPQPPVAQPVVAILNQPNMVGRPLPMSNIPNSSDMVSGQWSGRLQDAGDFQLVFPNKEASDGQAWRNRFDSFGKNQWIEIRNNGFLEHVGCIEKVDIKRDQVTISGHDGWFQLKGAYQRDWIAVYAPRDVIERGTKVWSPIVLDNWPVPGTDPSHNKYTSPYGVWTDQSSSTGSTALAPSPGGIVFTMGASGGPAAVQSTFPAPTINPATGIWSVAFQFVNVVAAAITIAVTESTGDIYEIILAAGTPVIANILSSAAGSVPGGTIVAQATNYSLILESDGQWVTAFVNGAMIGCLRRIHSTTSSLLFNVVSQAFNTKVTMSSCVARVLQPFLMRGSQDKGDYVLPGSASTYPFGGLHGRYFNNADLSGDGDRLYKINSPPRTQAFGGAGTSEYANRQDPQIVGGMEAPLPGVSNSAGVGQYWSAVWFGSIYLKLSAGNYSMNLQTGGPGLSARVWVGQTEFGTQLVDQWVLNTAGTHNYGFTISAANLGGTLPYDQSGNVVKRDGWYPIKIEYAVDSTFASGPTLQLLNSPAAYTDPGGTAIASGAQTTTVPSTSLSPLGMVDQRYQGVSHFDLVQQTANAFGYQATMEPQALESLEFPGNLAPRIREGQDFDAILEPDDNPHAEGLVNYGNILDATDAIVTLQGNGAGFQNGTNGQLQSTVTDIPTLDTTMFDIQGWQDFSDASFPSLLQALLNSQLGLRLQPWQVVSGDPTGRQRLANTWPLPSALAEMRWRPGDGMRVFARDINLQDASPRQLLLITRQISPNGITGTTVGFAERPRTAPHVLKQTLFQATRWQRNYQRQLVTLSSSFDQGSVVAGSGNLLVAGTGFPPWAAVSLSPGDQMVRARVRVAIASGTSLSYGLWVWSGSAWVDKTAALGGPWSAAPINLDITSVAVISTDNRLIVIMGNKGANAISDVEFQLFVDVLR